MTDCSYTGGECYYGSSDDDTCSHTGSSCYYGSEPITPPPPTCEWFALCTNEAVGVIVHPILGRVPCCQRCADKLEMANRLLPFI